MIHLAKDFYLGADTYNLILYEEYIISDGHRTKPENVGKKQYKELGYYKTMRDAVGGMLRIVSRRSLCTPDVLDFVDAFEDVMEVAQEVMDKIDAIEKYMLREGVIDDDPQREDDAE